MVVSKKTRDAIQYYQQKTAAKRSIKPLTDLQFKHILNEFWGFANQHGFYLTRKAAREKDGFYVFAWQKEIAISMLTALFQQKDTELTISILRQVGKTEFVGLTGAFIFEYFYKTFGVPVNIAVIAPEKKMACVPFERLERYLNKKYLIEDTKDRKLSVKSDSIKLFGIYDEYKGSTIEGNTFDMVIRDEAHKGSDSKFKDEVIPTMGMKRGCLIRIGNGGFYDCDYRQSILRGNKVNLP